MWLLTVYLGLLALAVAGMLYLLARHTIAPGMGTQLFSALALGAVLLIAFITPALTAGAISGERERRTLELLLVTRASPFGLVCGKLLGSLCYVIFLLVAALPAFALVYLFGGVPLRYLLMVVAVAVVTALAHTALGLALSALLRRTLFASVVAYVLVLAVVIGLPLFGLIVQARQQVLPQRAAPSTATIDLPEPTWVGLPPSAYLYASPLLALASVLPGTTGGSALSALGVTLAPTPYPGMLGSAVYVTGTPYGISSYAYGTPMGPYGPGGGQTVAGLSLFRSLYTLGIDPSSGQPVRVVAWAPWVAYCLFSGLLTALYVGLATLALAPVKPWRAWSARRRPRTLGASEPA
jgi:ABC-type transport system involved in multi-copper enzyme maturation permease subunit